MFGILRAAYLRVYHIIFMIRHRYVGWPAIDRKVRQWWFIFEVTADLHFQTGKSIREQQPLLRKIKMMLLFNPLAEWSTSPDRYYPQTELINDVL